MVELIIYGEISLILERRESFWFLILFMNLGKNIYLSKI